MKFLWKCSWMALSTVMLLTTVSLAQNWADESMALWHEDGQGNTLPYRLFLPPGLVHGEKYPLVVYLHGGSSKGNDNISQISIAMYDLIEATREAEYASFLVVPQADVDIGDWYDVASLVEGILQDVQNSYPEVDSGRIYLSGWSWGGKGTLQMVYALPEKFTAAVSVSGGMWPPHLEHQGVPERLASIPWWFFHGANDSVIPVEHSRAPVEAIRAAGGDVRYTEYSDLGHLIPTVVFSDIDDELYPWLFAQQRSTPFLRGDTNIDATIDLADAMFTLSYLFTEGAAPRCLDTADCNDDSEVDIADAISIIWYLFGDESPLPAPFGECGIDPTADGLGCASYEFCQDR